MLNTYKFLSVLWLIPRSSALPLHAYSRSCMHKYSSPAHVGYMHTHPLLGVQVYLFTHICSGRCRYSSFICTSAAPHNPLIHMSARRHPTRSHSTLEVLLLVAPMYGGLTNQLECKLLTAFCREAAPPCLCEGHGADKAASSGVRLDFHCCCVMKVSPVLSQFFVLLLYFFSNFSFPLMVILNRCHHSYFPLPIQDRYRCPGPIYTCWYTLIPAVSTGVAQAIYQERKS